MSRDYWRCCIEEALGDVGIQATEEQIENITGWIEGAAENRNQACGYDMIPNPLVEEIEMLKKEKAKYRDELSDLRNIKYKYENVKDHNMYLDRVIDNLKDKIKDLQE